MPARVRSYSPPTSIRYQIQDTRPRSSSVDNPSRLNSKSEEQPALSLPPAQSKAYLNSGSPPLPTQEWLFEPPETSHSSVTAESVSQEETKLPTTIEPLTVEKNCSRKRSLPRPQRPYLRSDKGVVCQEWPLPDANLKRTIIGNEATFQLEFRRSTDEPDQTETTAQFEEWALDTAVLGYVVLGKTKVLQLQFEWPCTREDPTDWRDKKRRRARAQSTKHKGRKRPRSRKFISYDEIDDRDPDVYAVDRILTRWKNKFLLLWGDGTTGWEPRSNISTALLDEFETDFQLVNDGVEITDSRTVDGVEEYLLDWRGRPDDEREWAGESEVSQDCISKYLSQKS